MQITLVQGLLIALLVFICAIDKHMETFMWFRPLVVAFFTGIILGDVRLGMQAGAVAELSYLGLLTVGGTVPPDPLFAGLMTTVLAYTTGCDVNTALGLAVPFALIGQWINTGTNTFYAGFLPKVDKCAAAGRKRHCQSNVYRLDPVCRHVCPCRVPVHLRIAERYFRFCGSLPGMACPRL